LDAAPALVCRRRQGREDGAQASDDLLIAADHQAVAFGQAPDAAAGAHVHEVQAACLQGGGAAH